MFMYLPTIRNSGTIAEEDLTHRTRSLGINPSSGGSPPKEKSPKARMDLCEGDRRDDEDRSFGVLIFMKCINIISRIKWIVYEIKYRSVIKLEKGILNRSQPMCPIEENAKSGRISVWISPPTPPTMAFRAARAGRIYEFLVFSTKIHNGAIFCHVDRNRAAGQLRLAITAGYQLWNGEAPIFINMARKIVISGSFRRSGPTKKINEAYAWMKKYFIAARIASGLFGSSIIGIKAMVLTSRAAHVYSGILAERATMVEEIRDQQKSHWINNIEIDGGVEPPNWS